ncbi:MAG: UdgX family uracil-DNA binding protein [Acidobacteria bacterium]|nr:UdgX family uracil-DNA binding protein [Acidobacteriota bacterium]
MEIRFSGLFEDWQKRARELLKKDVAPRDVIWVEESGQQPLFDASAGTQNISSQVTNGTNATSFKVPKRFVELARNVAAFRDTKKWGLLYSVLWRIARENHHLLKVETDDEVIQLLRMEDAVSRDVHHMHAFVRFKKVTDTEGERYIAWYKPDHKSIRLAAPFFAKRFAGMRWSILTPDGSAHWDGKALRFSSGVDTPPANEDGLEELWSKYYATTFNPARTNLRMMRSEMPQRFWNNMPELANLGQVLAKAPGRVEEMIAVQKKTPGAGAFVPPNADLKQLREAVSGCEGCELYKHATQPVFGEGPADARIVLIGEQPGDSEDRAGRPFVGPAGEVLNRALAEAGMNRSEVYLTNAVKHFAFEERGKRRIHRTPRLSEVTTCKPWMEAELEQVAPEILVCMGATAAKAVFGAQFRLTEQRGKFLESRFAAKTLTTYHPSAVLRADSPAAQDALYRVLVEDLKSVAVEARRLAKNVAATAVASGRNRKSLFS